MNRLKLVSLATAFAVLGLSGADTAHASVINAGHAYAVASNKVTNLLITTSGTTFTFGDTITTSYAEASLLANTTGLLSTTGTNVSVTDAPAANLGVAFPENDYSLHGPDQFTQFARADALISANQAAGNPASDAIDIAEVNLIDPGASGDAEAGNRSETDFTVGAGGGVMDFTFDALPYMLVDLTGGGTATTTLIFSIIIEENGAEVFKWLPDGVTGTFLGGMDTADSNTLNDTLNVHGLYNPGGSSYAATTNLLFDPSKDYTLKIDMPEKASATVVPAPGTIALFGLGLAGLGFSRRRKA